MVSSIFFNENKYYFDLNYFMFSSQYLCNKKFLTIQNIFLNNNKNQRARDPLDAFYTMFPTIIFNFFFFKKRKNISNHQIQTRSEKVKTTPTSQKKKKKKGNVIRVQKVKWVIGCDGSDDEGWQKLKDGKSKQKWSRLFCNFHEMPRG